MASTQKLDLYKKHKAEYATPRPPQLVEIKSARYLTIAGRGEPGGEVFTAKIGCLYGVAYTMKMRKKAAGRDYVVCKLECLWGGDDPDDDFTRKPQQQWGWRLLIRVPDFITPRDREEAVRTLQEKGKNAGADEVELETIEEGPCVQMLHVGPYAKVGDTIAAMAAFAGEQGLALHGPHHEIYLSDPRRVPEDRLRTILRHPVRSRFPRAARGANRP
jgi:hypothetical protein